YFIARIISSTSLQHHGTAATTTNLAAYSRLSHKRSKRREGTGKTASQAGPSATRTNASAITPVLLKSNAQASANPRFPSPSFQPPYPSPSPVPTSSTPEQPHVRISTPTRWSLRSAFNGGANPDFSYRFRSRASSNASSRPRRVGGGRLWNPTNSTPRAYPQTPTLNTRTRNRSDVGERTVIAIPLSHPDISSPKEGAAAQGEYPLLTLPEQRQKRHSASTRASLQVERSGSSNGNSNRISLPRSVSIDIARRKSGESSPLEPKFDKGKGKAVDFYQDDITLEKLEKRPTGYRRRGQSISDHPTASVPGLSFDKGKRKAIMSTDLERGPVTQTPYEPGGTSSLPNESNTSLPTGIGPALSSNNTSIIGSDGPPPNPGEEWGPQHPCFPHMNPHVPLSSPLYQTTRIIRVRRDWMLEGDLAPTFSNLYPEILDPAGLSEQDFRTVIQTVNNELIPAFNPWAPRNIFDGVMGLLTGWMWDDLGLTGTKSRLRKVESYLEQWNREMERRGKEGSGSAPRIVSLRRTGYMNLDIQVPDPEVAYPLSVPGDERTDTGVSGTSK
ncbi:Ras modification ERF4, partial [Hyphodiscus hymeniophilus]